MKWLVLPVLAAAAIGGVLLPAGAHPAYACSGGEDKIGAPDVIVAGRFTGWELVEGGRRHDLENGYFGHFDPVRVEMVVDRVYKGTVTPTIQIIDGASLSGADNWAGSAGSCGAFDFDPTGTYAIMGLVVRDDGSYWPNRLFTFFMGPEPPETYDAPLLSLLAPLLPGTLPTTGSASPSEQSGDGIPWLPIVLASALGGSALLATSAFLLRFRLTRG